MNTRLSLRTIPLTPDEQLERWKSEVQCAMEALKDAIEAPMPTHRNEYVRVKPGEAGYDEAVYEECIDMHPLVFKLDANGKVIQ